MRSVFTTEVTPVYVFFLLAINEDIMPISCVGFVQMLGAGSHGSGV
jgi:hypothetical protein